MLYQFEYSDGEEVGTDICRCLNNILSIPCGSIPLSRALGVSWSNLSKTPPNLENDIATEIIEKVEMFEPRVSVREVSFEYEPDGVVTIQLFLEKGEG